MVLSAVWGGGIVVVAVRGVGVVEAAVWDRNVVVVALKGRGVVLAAVLVGGVVLAGGRRAAGSPGEPSMAQEGAGAR